MLLLASAAVREGPSSAVDQAIVWLPSGVAVAGLWLLGLRAGWVVFAVTMVQRLLLGYETGEALPAAAGSTAEAVIGVLVLRRLRLRPSLSRLRDVAAVLVAAAAAPLGSILFSWIGRGVSWPHPDMPFYSGWDGWWRMNALGVVAVVPVALTWSGTPWRRLGARAVAGTLLAVAGIPALLLAALVAVPPGVTGVMLLNFVLGLVLYAAVRFGLRGATLASVLAAITVAIATARGLGPFLEVPREQRHVALQLFELSFVAFPPAFGALLAERRAARARSARSDELRRSMQAALPDVLYRIRHDGVCLDVSVPPGVDPPFRPADRIGRTVFDQLPTGSEQPFREEIQRAFARGVPATLEYEVTVAGRRRFREARCVPHGADEILAVVRDITDRKWVEGSMAFGALVLEQVAAGRPRAEVFTAVVQGLERQMPGARCALQVPEEGRPRGPASAPGLRASWSVPIRDSGGAVLGTLAIHHDEPRRPEPAELALVERAGVLAGLVLERERDGEALRRSEDLLASINRNVKEGLFRAAPDLRLLYANPALARLLGYERPEDVVGRSLADVIEDARVAEPGGTVAGAGHWLNGEVRLRRRDGTAFWGLLSGTAIRDAAGAITFYDGAVADITVRKDLDEQLRQSQKLEAVGKLAGGVAHDFNNLLTVIVGYAETIRGEADAPPIVRAHASEVLGAAQRASGLTRQLLAYSRQQMLAPRALDLNAVVGRMGSLLRRLIGEEIRLVVEPAPGACWVLVDPSQIEQVILNLAVNARDAMPAGGTLTIATSTQPACELQARLRADHVAGPCVMLHVHDTGVGMSGEVRTRAFDPFFTTKEPGKGTGLGLSTVYGIVKQSGGTVWLDSDPGAGTTVRICLPRLAAPEREAEAPPPAAASAGGATILLVEDEPAVRELVRRTLEFAGHRVVEAADGADALERCRGLEGPLDLVVTDVVMPRMNGRELAARLLASRPGLRFLFVSGYTDDAREFHELAGGAGDFLPKPFTPPQLLERVDSLLRARELRA